MLLDWLRAWNRFWFTAADPTPLGLIRIFCGLVVLYVHAAYTPDLQEFFGRDAWFNLQAANEYRAEAPWVPPPLGWEDESAAPTLITDGAPVDQAAKYASRWGLSPDLALARGSYNWSIWFHVTDPVWMRIVHGGALFVFLLFTVGLWTRLTSVLAWMAALSYVHRSPMTLFGMDTMINVALLYLMIGPSGAAFSVDSWLVRRQKVGDGHADNACACRRPATSVSANIAIRLFQAHFCIIYMAAGLSKLLGSAWWNGTALWGTLANWEFTPLRFALYAESLRWICRHRWLWEILMATGTFYTLILEISFPFLVWKPGCRGLMIAGAVLLHTSIAVTMGLVHFGLIMLALVFAFIPAKVIRERMGMGADTDSGDHRSVQRSCANAA
jgi:hypothetical protein